MIRRQLIAAVCSFVVMFCVGALLQEYLWALIIERYERGEIVCQRVGPDFVCRAVK